MLLIMCLKCWKEHQIVSCVHIIILFLGSFFERKSISLLTIGGVLVSLLGHIFKTASQSILAEVIGNNVC